MPRFFQNKIYNWIMLDWISILFTLCSAQLSLKLIACIAQIIFDSQNLKESVFVHLFLG